MARISGGGIRRGGLGGRAGGIRIPTPGRPRSSAAPFSFQTSTPRPPMKMTVSPFALSSPTTSVPRMPMVAVGVRIVTRSWPSLLTAPPRTLKAPTSSEVSTLLAASPGL